MLNLLEEGIVKKRAGSHWHSAESISDACIPYHQRCFWSKIFDWLGWVIVVGGAICYTVSPSNQWLVWGFPLLLISIVFHYALDPKKMLTYDMCEYLRIQKMWKPVRDFYLNSGFVDLTIPSFSSLCDRSVTQLGFDCLYWVINRDTHNLRNAVRDVFDKAILDLAYKVHVAEVSSDASEITKARESLENLLAKFQGGEYTPITNWTVGGAIQRSIKEFGVYNPLSAAKR